MTVTLYTIEKIVIRTINYIAANCIKTAQYKAQITHNSTDKVHRLDPGLHMKINNFKHNKKIKKT